VKNQGSFKREEVSKAKAERGKRGPESIKRADNPINENSRRQRVKNGGLKSLLNLGPPKK